MIGPEHFEVVITTIQAEVKQAVLTISREALTKILSNHFEIPPGETISVHDPGEMPGFEDPNHNEPLTIRWRTL